VVDSYSQYLIKCLLRARQNGMESRRWVLNPALGCSEKNVIKR